MPISLRSAKSLMRRTVPGKKISDDAARLLLIYLQRKAEDLAVHASRIHDMENSKLRECGIREKVILSPRHMKMAIDGKYAQELARRNGGSEH